MSYIYSSEPRRHPAWTWLIVSLIIAVIGYSGIRYLLDQSNYTKGHQACLQLNCAEAISYFDNVLTGWRLFDIGGYAALAKQERAECVSAQVGVEKEQRGDLGGALLAYNDFLTNHVSSFLAGVVRNRAKYLFKQTDPFVLAKQGVCKYVDALLSNNLLSRSDTKLPELYFRCGQRYVDDKDYTNSIVMYEQFLRDYPNHPLASEVQAALARSIVADARGRGAHELPPPERIGSTTGGYSVVTIQNDSPQRLQIVFSGPEARIEELQACALCSTYTESSAPLHCPERGPIGRYTLKPGQYDVVVRSLSDTSTIPWRGSWPLSSGDEYHSCFIIVTEYIPDIPIWKKP